MAVSVAKIDETIWSSFEIQPATNPTSEKERAAKLVDPGFGRIFTDHMAIVRYSQSKGWHDARVESSEHLYASRYVRIVRQQSAKRAGRRFARTLFALRIAHHRELGPRTMQF